MDEVEAGEIMWRRTVRACKLAALFYVLTIVSFILALVLVVTFAATAGNPKPPDTSFFDSLGNIGLYSLPLLMFAATFNVIRATYWSFRGMRSPLLSRHHPWRVVFLGGLIVLFFEFSGWLNYFN